MTEQFTHHQKYWKVELLHLSIIIIECIGQIEHLLSTVKRRNMSYFGHTHHAK